MKRILLLFVSALTLAAASAQSYVALKDTIFGCRYFANDPRTGQPFSVGSKTGTYSLSWPSQSDIEVCYFVKIPKGHVRADMFYTPVYGKRMVMNVTITDADTKRVIYKDQINSDLQMSSSETSIQLFPDIDFPADTWYQIKLVTVAGNEGIRNLNRLIFQHTATERVVSPTVFMAPSAHNNTWATTDPDAPSGNAYDWAYGEFLYPDMYKFPSRYLMCLGGSGYYSGIQVCYNYSSGELYNTALFSAWDNGDTDKNPNLPAYLRSGGIDNNTDVKISRFGNEGTGIQSMMSPAHWLRDHWVQWLINSRPETTTVTLKTKDGRDSVITYVNTILTAWYKMEDDPEWHYVSSLRQSGTSHLLGQAGEYSFLECFSDRGGDNYVRCYMKNRFYRSASSGKWYNRNHMTPGHYNYNDGARECRYDYGHGATNEYDNCFYIEHGGFGQVNDANMYVPLQANTECVDTIDIDAKQARINQAFITNNYKYTTHLIDSLNRTTAGKAQILAMAKEIVENAGKVGYYGTAETQPLAEAYNNGAPASIAELAATIKELTQTTPAIRYANITNAEHLGAQRAYIFENLDNSKLLYAEMVDGTPVIKLVDADRTDMNANWAILKSDHYGTTAIYNLGLGLYLNFDSPTLLSETPQNISAIGRWGKGWYFGANRTTAINITADGNVTKGSYNTSGSQFLIHDNLSFTPSDELVHRALEKSEAPGRFAEYKNMVPKILSTPEGVVGAWTNQNELDNLTALYDDGNIAEDKADELISLIDNAQKIELTPNQIGVFTITSAAAGSEDSPYLTIDADNYVYHKAATSKPDQIWVASPKNGGHELSSQGRALNTLSATANSNVSTKESGNGAAYFLADLGEGKYTLSDVQYGPIALGGTTSPLKTFNTASAENGWILRPATEVKMALNSIGVQSLYLDFDVKIPEGLEVYKLVGFDANGPLLEEVTDTIHARTPVILHGDNYGSYTFSIIPEQNFPTETSIFTGTLLKKSGLKSKTFYTVTAKSGKPCIALTLGTTVNANQCYITKEVMDELGLTESQYDIDFDNITAAKAINANGTTQNTDTQAYDLQGRPTNANANGIIIKDGQTIRNK